MAYTKLPAFVLGFHGCDRDLKKKLLLKEVKMKPSQNCYDWLGEGAYFWENDPQRAFSYAKYIKENPKRCPQKIINPDVIGAVLDLRYCLNLFDEENLLLVKQAYESYKKVQKASGLDMPENKGGNDLLQRNLDCAVINFLHGFLKENKRQTFDSVRAPFWEGNELYPNAGFREKNHIQICIRNYDCIKGFFDPITDGQLLFSDIE